MTNEERLDRLEQSFRTQQVMIDRLHEAMVGMSVILQALTGIKPTAPPQGSSEPND